MKLKNGFFVCLLLIISVTGMAQQKRTRFILGANYAFLMGKGLRGAYYNAPGVHLNLQAGVGKKNVFLNLQTGVSQIRDKIFTFLKNQAVIPIKLGVGFYNNDQTFLAVHVDKYLNYDGATAAGLQAGRLIKAGKRHIALAGDFIFFNRNAQWLQLSLGYVFTSKPKK